MTTIVIEANNDQQERDLLSFLNDNEYSYTLTDSSLFNSQKEEILKRELDFESLKIKSEPWEEVKKRFLI